MVASNSSWLSAGSAEVEPASASFLLHPVRAMLVVLGDRLSIKQSRRVMRRLVDARPLRAPSNRSPRVDVSTPLLARSRYHLRKLKICANIHESAICCIFDDFSFQFTAKRRCRLFRIIVDAFQNLHHRRKIILGTDCKKYSTVSQGLAGL